MTHQLINTGAGWRCLRCKVAWDQGEAVPETCEFEVPSTPALQQHVEQIGYEDLRQKTGDMDLAKRFWEQQTNRVGAKSFPKPAAMSAQIGGNHYRSLAIQPTEFSMRNGLDFCIGSILKYLTRWRSKNGLEDIRKAKHFVEIREAFPHDIHPPRQIAITMLEYVTRNNIRPDDAEALYRLEAYYNAVGHHGRIGADRLMLEIDRLMDRAALT